MRDMTGIDLAAGSGVKARKLPVDVVVEFAVTAGRLETLEGPVAYTAGDALLTGSVGDRWPVRREKFLQTYAPAGNGQAGEPGIYRKKPLVVHALQLHEPFTVKVGPEPDPINGKPGDWLIQYSPGEYGIVSGTLFSRTYELLRSTSS